MTYDDGLGRWAEFYASIGWHVIPLWWSNYDGTCACGNPECKNIGKHPIGQLVPNGEGDATRAVLIIRGWWTRYPLANIGGCTGPSDKLVIDLETDEAHDQWLGFITACGVDVPEPCVQRTGGGGFHLIWDRCGMDIKSMNRIMEDTDLKARTGYIVLAPSLHRSGRRYEMLTSFETRPFPAQLAATLASMRGG